MIACTNSHYREDIGYTWPKNTFVDNCEADSSASKNRLAKRDALNKRNAKKMKKAKRSWLPFS